MQGARVTDAIVLVAGRGSRLRPLTDDTPKCLLEVGGQSLLMRLIGQLRDHGIERVVLATGYMAGAIEAAVSEAAQASEADLPDVVFATNPAFDQTNNAESLRLAMAAGGAEGFLLCDGDILVERSGWLGELLDDERGNVLAMIAQERLGDEEMKIVLSAGEGDVRHVTGLSKELDPATAHGESLGVQTIAAHSVEALADRLARMSDEERATAYYEDIFAELIDAGHRFYARAVPRGAWTEIDTVEDLEHARALWRDWNRDEPGADR